MDADWLKEQHPLYKQRAPEWRRNERRLRGGIHVLPELRRFDWESMPTDGLPTSEAKDVLIPTAIDAPGEHYNQRQAMAMYVNFPETFMGLLAGHLLRNAPKPGQGLNFGTLGEVPRERKAGTRSEAELVYFNADGVGNDGSQWDPFWASVVRWSGATGHRWLMVEAPLLPGTSEKEVQDGRRPWLVHLSPLEFPNWDYADGKLAWILQQLPPRPARIENGKVVREKRGPMRLYVRQGYDALGAIYTVGGWWTFDEKGTLLTDLGMQGRWDGTDGQIPIWAHYYERDKDFFSRPGVSEIGNAAVAWMNLQSAGHFDAWDGASSISFMPGVTPAAFQIAKDMRAQGSQWIPLPGDAEAKTVPTVVDSGAGMVSVDVFIKSLDMIRATVREIAGLEAASAPESSGLSKLIGFAEGKSPRLGLLASELETSQNIALHFLEKRFGHGEPQGEVRWPREFDLAPLLDSIERYFEIQSQAGLRSKTLAVKAVMAAGRETGLLVSDEEEKSVELELATGFEEAADQRRRAADLVNEFGRGGRTIPEPAGAGGNGAG